jgi:hypothetical protein
VRPECRKQITKVEALLADMKKPWSYGYKILRHQGVDKWEWATSVQLSAVITALCVEQDKLRLEAAVIASLSAIGRDRTTAPTIAKALGCKKPAQWNRDRDTMRAMLEHLQRVANVRQGGTP